MKNVERSIPANEINRTLSNKPRVKQGIAHRLFIGCIQNT